MDNATIPANAIGSSNTVPQHGQGGDSDVNITPNYSGLLVWTVQGRINMGSGTDVDIWPNISGTYSDADLTGAHVYGTNQTNWSVNGQATVQKGKAVSFGSRRSNGASMTTITNTWHIIPNVVGA